MTLNELISELRLIIRGQELYDDDELDDRLLKQWVHNQRALWIRNETNKNHSIDDQIIQKACIPLEIADRSDCPVQVTQYDVLRSTLPIPKTIELHQSDGIIRISPVDQLALDFSYVPIERAKVAGNGRFNKTLVFSYRYHSYLYVHSQKSSNYARYLRFLMVYALWEDPVALAQFNHIDGTPCYSDTDDYPLNSWMWNYIKGAILRTEFDLLVAAPEDKVNDADDKPTSDVERK